MMELIETRTDWEALLGQAAFHTNFHTWEWRNVLTKTFSWLTPKYMRYESREGDSAIIPFYLFSRNGKKHMSSLPFSEYGGPVVLSKKFSGAGMMAEILELSRKNDYSFKINVHPFIQKRMAGEPALGPNLDLRTYILPLDKDIEGIYGKFRANNKKAIREARKSVKVVDGKKEDLRALYSLYVDTMKRNLTVCVPFSFLKNMHEELSPKNMITVRLAMHENRVVAGIINLEYGEVSHYTMGGGDKKYFGLYPNNLLHWTAVESAAGNGKKFYDFGGTRKGSTLEVFKGGWGCETFDIPRYFFGLDDDAPAKGSLIRNAWGRLPAPIIELLSPSIARKVIT